MRKWISHGLIYLLLAALVTGGVAYACYTNPTAVRGLVQQQLSERFRNVSVSVERARLRLLGGILVRELRLARNDGLDRRDFLYVPTAVIYHDKEHLLEGQLSVHKVELLEPQVRIVRERDGSLNVAGILGPAGGDGSRLPTIVIRKGTVVFEDRAANAPLLEIRDAQINLVNDPLPTLQIDGSGTADVLGPVRFRGTINRTSRALDLELELPEIPVGHDLIARAGLLCPDLTRHAAELTGRATLTAHVRHEPAEPKPLRYDIRVKLRDGRFAHKSLPTPLEQIEFDARCVDGRVPSATLKAASGPAKLEVRVAELDIPTGPHELPEPDELGREMDVTVTDLPVTNAVLDCLPREIQWVKKEYVPSGPVTVRYRFRKRDGGRPSREWTLEPKGMSCCYENFEYPIHDIRGKIRIDTSRLPERDIALDLTGKGGDSPVSLRGTLKGKRTDGEVRIDIVGKSLLLDHRIHKALGERSRDVVKHFLPEDSRKLGLSLRPIGKGDVTVELRRPTGGTDIDRRYVIAFEGCRALYDQFPYPLENVSGVLELRRDHWECRGFRGTHNGGEFFVEGRSQRLEGPGNPERVTVRVSGKGVLLDREFEQALVPIGGDDRKGLQKAWRTLQIGGRLDFTSEIIDQPHKPQAIDVTVGVTGCTLKPTFFDYAMRDVSATVRYVNDRVNVSDFTARHGDAKLSLGSALIVLGADGAYTAWLDGVRAGNLAADRDLTAALPESLRRTLDSLALRAPLDVNLNLVVASPAGGLSPVKLWWDGGASVKKAGFRAGVEVTGADGRFHCRGHHDGRQLRGVKGDVVLDRASVFGQPLERVHARLEVKHDSPDVVRFRDLKADFFGGTIGGEARLDLVPVLRYDVYLEALNVQLDRFGKHNLGESAAQAQLSGPARAAVHLTGESDDLLNLKGNGQVEVKQGKMGQLPVLLDVVKAFGLRLPDRTAFEQAQLQFGLEGPRVIVQQLDLYGNAVSLRGQGTCDLDGGNLNLDFTASLGRFSQVLPAALDIIPETISQQLYKIKMRGSLGPNGALNFDQVPVPGVIEPIRRAMRN